MAGHVSYRGASRDAQADRNVPLEIYILDRVVPVPLRPFPSGECTWLLIMFKRKCDVSLPKIIQVATDNREPTGGARGHLPVINLGCARESCDCADATKTPKGRKESFQLPITGNVLVLCNDGYFLLPVSTLPLQLLCSLQTTVMRE